MRYLEYSQYMRDDVVVEGTLEDIDFINLYALCFRPPLKFD